MSLAPWIGIGQVLAGLGDRFSRRTLLVVSDLSRAGIFLVIASIELPVATILGLAFLAGCFDPPFEASRAALVPKLVTTEAYGHALALSGYVSNVGLLAGYALGGGLSAWIGPSGALFVNAATFMLSAMLVARIPQDHHAAERRRSDVRGALRFVRSDRVVVTSVIVYGAVAFLGMSIEGIAAPYAIEVLGYGDAQVGLLLAMVPAGTISATLLLRPIGSDRSLVRLAGMASAIAGLVAMPVFGLSLARWWPYVGFFAAGAAFSASIPTNTAAGRRIPDDIRASTFGILQGVVVGSHAIGAAVGGLLASRTSLEVATTVGAVALVGAGVAAYLSAARLPATSGPVAAPDR